jgi:hypothetical protein
MADGVSIEIIGVAGVIDMLETLKTTAAERCIRKALRAGAAIEKDAIETLAPIRPVLPSGTALPPGALANDVTVSLKRSDEGEIIAVVHPGKLTAHVASWVEYGHRQVRGGASKLMADGSTKGDGVQIYVKPQKGQVGLGTVPAHPYIRPAYESSLQAVTEAIATTLAEEVTKAAKNTKNSDFSFSS